MSQFRKLFGQTATYGLSSIVGRLLNYLLVPFYTYVFAPAEYGIVTELYAEVAFLNIIYTFGLETTFFRFATRDPDKQQSIFNQVQTLILVISIFLSGFFILASEKIALILQYPEYGYTIRWLGWIMAIDALVAVPFAKLRLEGKAIKFASYKLINICLNLGLNFFFIYFLPKFNEGPVRDTLYNENLGVGYVFLSNLIANAIYLILFSKDLLSVRFSIDTSLLKKIVKYAFPLVILGLAGVTNEMFSRIMLKYLLPEELYPMRSNREILGIFGACYKLSIFMTLAVQAFKYAYEPFFFKASTQRDAKETYSKVMKIFIAFGGLAWLGITLILPELAPYLLRSKEYLEGLDIVPALLGGGLFLGIYYNLSVWYKVTDNTRYGAIISILGVLFTVLLNLFLIPKLGMMGSAWATFATYGLMMVVSFVWGQRVYYVQYDLLLAFLLIAISGITVYIIDYEQSILMRYITGLAGIFVYLTVFFLFEKFRKQRKA